jgi:hypothetical protein
MSTEKRRTKHAAGSLRHQVLVAALACVNDDPEATFTAEDLLLEAWRRDSNTWGLRGHESEYPDSERLHAELRRAHADGDIEPMSTRQYRLTPAGLAKIALLPQADADPQGKVERAFEEEVRKTLGHSVFRDWLKDPNTPKRFRDAGSFWGIAPGTPSTIVQDRLRRIDKTLEGALALLDKRGVEVITDRGRRLFERRDIERCAEFHRTLRERFLKDLKLLGGA